MSEPAPLVVKIGGGLLREQGLQGLERACADVHKAASAGPVLVVPGGGPFADAVRAIDAQIGLTDRAAHALALQAMDQLGTLLAEMLPTARLVSELVVPGALDLLRAAPAFAARPDVPESWEVTSDSLAVLAAGAIGAEQAVLLKPVAGLLERWPSDEAPVAQLTARELGTLQAAGGGRVVDAHLPEAVRRSGVSVIVRAPGSGDRSGTRLTPG